MAVFGAFGAEGRLFQSHSNRYAGTLGKFLTRVACIYDVMGALRGCLAVNFDSCNNLLASVHTLLVNILRYVSLYMYIKQKY